MHKEKPTFTNERSDDDPAHSSNQARTVDVVVGTQNVILTQHQHEMVEQLLRSGRYQNASEVVREGFRLLKREQVEEAANGPLPICHQRRIPGTRCRHASDVRLSASPVTALTRQSPGRINPLS